MTDRYASLKQGLVGCWIPSISGSGLLLPDLSGRGNNGAIVGADSTFYVGTAKGIAISSDGTNDAFSCSPIGTGLNQVCLSTWIKIDTYNNTDDLLLEHTANYNLNNGFISDPCAGNGRWAVAISNAATLPGFTSYNYWDFARPSAGVWNHVLTYFDRTQGLSASGLRTWVNGVEQTLANSFTVGSMSGNFDATTTYFLSRAASSLFLQAQIADIRLYSRLPTIPEILLLASEPGIGFKPANKLSRFSQRFTYKPAKPRNYSVIRNRDPNYSTLRQGLVAAYCPSISGQGNVLPDLVGGNHGTLTNMDASDWVSSGDGRALDFDGSNDRVTLPNDFQRNAQSGAISAWFKFAGNAANQNPIVSLGGNANLTVFAFRRRDTADANQNAIGLRIFSNNAPGGSNTEIFSTDKVNDGVWAHGLIQSNGSRYDLFVNGIRQTMIFTAGSDNGDWVADMTGTTGETICDIGAQWASGAFFSSLNGQVDDVRIYNRALTEPEIKLLASKRGIGLEPRKPKITFADLGVQKTYGVVRVKETDYGTLRQGLVGAWCPSLPNGGSGNTLPDVSGYNNHGTLTNMSPDDWVSASYGRALDFDGVNDYVSIPHKTEYGTLSTGGTICLWFRTTTSGVFQDIISKPSFNDFEFRIRSDTNKLQLLIGGSVSQIGNAVIATNAWYAVAITFKANESVCYLNGVVDFTAAFSITDNTSDINIGRRLQYTDFYFQGQMNDIRIYSRALSEPEIRLLASRPGIGLRQESHRQTFYQFPSFQPALAKRSSAIIGGGIT